MTRIPRIAAELASPFVMPCCFMIPSSSRPAIDRILRTCEPRRARADPGASQLGGTADANQVIDLDPRRSTRDGPLTRCIPAQISGGVGHHTACHREAVVFQQVDKTALEKSSR